MQICKIAKTAFINVILGVTLLAKFLTQISLLRRSRPTARVNSHTRAVTVTITRRISAIIDSCLASIRTKKYKPLTIDMKSNLPTAINILTSNGIIII